MRQTLDVCPVCKVQITADIIHVHTTENGPGFAQASPLHTNCASSFTGTFTSRFFLSDCVVCRTTIS